MGCTISSTLFLGVESSVVVPKPLISSRKIDAGSSQFFATLPRTPVLPVPGYADESALFPRVAGVK